VAKRTKSRSRSKRAARDPSIPEFCYCSFCLKSEDDVKYLIAGPGNIFICEECVSFCNWVLDEYNAGHTIDFSKVRRCERLPTERLLSQLRSIDESLRGKSTQLQFAVETLRSRKISWGRIAEAMGMSRQSAWERFS
jgi:ClpX C4-type zinc finger